MSDKVENPVDVLDQIKEREQAKRKKLLLDKIPELKKMAKQVLILKKRTDLLLTELGLSERDIKRVIDWINAEVDVQPTEDEIKKEKEEVKKDTTDDLKKIEERLKKIEDDKWSNLSYINAVGTIANTQPFPPYHNGKTFYCNDDRNNILLCSSNASTTLAANVDNLKFSIN